MLRAQCQPRNQAGDHGDQQAFASGKITVNAGLHPIDRREYHAEQQTIDAVLRVEKRRMDVAIPNHDAARHQHHATNRKQAGDDDIRPQMQTRKDQQQRRQEQIKMFLHREAPGLCDRRTQIVLQMRQVLDQERAGRMTAGEYVEQYQHVIGRPNLEDAANDEAPCIHAAGLRILAQQQAANEKTA